MFSGRFEVIPDSNEGRVPDDPFEPLLQRTSFVRRLWNNFTFPRIRRATIAGTIVMLVQTFSGINAIAFLSTTFFEASFKAPDGENTQLNSYRLAIAFGVTNAVASAIPYFLVDDKTEKIDEKAITYDNYKKGGIRKALKKFFNHLTSDPKPREERQASIRLESIRASSIETQSSNDLNHNHLSNNDDDHDDDDDEFEDESDELISDERSAKFQFRGRRFLLLTSLASCMVILFITALLFQMDVDSPARPPLIITAILLYTVFYSIGMHVPYRLSIS